MTQIYRCKQIRNSQNLFNELFESRLDSILVRAKYCPTIKSARQLIAHKHIKVNRKIEQKYSHTLKQGDSIEINFKSRKLIKTNLMNLFKERIDAVIWPAVPSYLTINYKTLEIIFGNIRNFNFSSSFSFKNENNRVIDYYRH